MPEHGTVTEGPPRALTRSRMRFVQMTLSTDHDAGPPIYESQCTTCSDQSGGSDDSESPEVWCLRHTGRTGHTGFRGIITSFFRVTPTDNGS